LVDGPANGTLVFNPDGTFNYTPNANFHGGDSFTFTSHDGSAASEIATVSITVHPVNDAPTLSGAAFVIEENSGIGTSVGSIAGADGDGDSLTYQIVGGNASGAFTIDSATGEIRVVDSLPLDFETIPEFVLTIEVADGGGLVATASVIVTLTDVSETLFLTIDVLPYSSSNTISSSGSGRTEVAILSTADFSVQSLDLTTLRFGRTGLENSLRWKKGSPEYRYEDVNNDGLLDVIVLFERDLMGFHAGDTEAHLTGQTLDGTEIAGEDDVNLTGSWPS
jgi:VCBS repeat-containing protein